VTTLQSGSRKGYSVRRITRPAGPLVVIEATCVCGLRFTEEHAQRWWVITAKRWYSMQADCPECGERVEFKAALSA
jgi:hypothetical protein